MSASMPPTRAATLRSSPAAIPFCARSTTCKVTRRSLNQRSALRVSAHFLVPKSCTITRAAYLRPRGRRPVVWRASCDNGHVLPRKKPATYADLVALPRHLVGEIVDGERPASLHARAASHSEWRSEGPSIGERGAGRVEHSRRARADIVGQVMVPDIAGWRRKRMPENPGVKESKRAATTPRRLRRPGYARVLARGARRWPACLRFLH